MADHEDDAWGDAVRGRYWPGPSRLAGTRYERFDGFLLLRARHLPTAGTLNMASVALGSAGADILGTWAALWRDAVGDVDAFAASVGHVEPAARTRGWDEARRKEAMRLADGGHRLEAAAELLALAVGGGRGPVRDVAFHVLEDATFLIACLRAGVPVRLTVAFPDRDPAYAVGGPGMALRIARGPEAEETAGRAKWLAKALNPDWASRAFRAEAGRGLGLSRGYADTAATLLDMALQGHVRAFLKHAVPKRGTWVVDLAGVRDFAGASARLFAAMGPHAASLFCNDPPDHALVVQAMTPFTHEHRFHCVGHRVVASTASVRALGLPDCAGRLLDPRVARLRQPADGAGPYDRGEAEPVEDRDLVARMAWLARRLARGLGREGRFHGHYVVDVGLTEAGEVAAIEVNTFANAGLYAVDVARIAAALGRWYADPARRAMFREEQDYELTWKVSRPAGTRAATRVSMARGLVARATRAVLRRPEPEPAKADLETMDIVEMVMRAAMHVGELDDKGWKVLKDKGAAAPEGD